MPRPRRAFDGGLFHLAVHASDRRFLFLSDRDRTSFLGLLSEVFTDYELLPAAYTLMGNHYHLMLYAPDARVSRAMQKLHTTYSRLHNRTRGRSAHLFRAHFAVREIVDERQLLSAYRYLALNPVRAGLARHPFAWQWSSSSAHAGLEAATIELDETRLRAAFENHPHWRQHYRHLVEGDGEAT